MTTTFLMSAFDDMIVRTEIDCDEADDMRLLRARVVNDGYATLECVVSDEAGETLIDLDFPAGTNREISFVHAVYMIPTPGGYQFPLRCRFRYPA